MAVIHKTTLTPTKLELLAEWLPTRPWYQGGSPELVKCGGFRLDDPAGEVGVEFMLVADTSGAAPVVHHVPLTYRGSPLEGGEHALIGTSEHGVLGSRWIYDGSHDPVLIAQLRAVFEGAAIPQAQSVNDTPDPTVVAHLDGALPAELTIVRALHPAEADTCPATGAHGCLTAGWQIPGGPAQRGPLVVAAPH